MYLRSDDGAATWLWALGVNETKLVLYLDCVRSDAAGCLQLRPTEDDTS
jgi:hypothetical protein